MIHPDAQHTAPAGQTAFLFGSYYDTQRQVLLEVEGSDTPTRLMPGVTFVLSTNEDKGWRIMDRWGVQIPCFYKSGGKQQMFYLGSEEGPKAKAYIGILSVQPGALQE